MISEEKDISRRGDGIMVLIFFLVLLAKAPFVILREMPINYDEIIYLVKSLNFAHHFSYYAPHSVQTDVPSYYAPFYSLLISVANLIPVNDPSIKYRLTLMVNSLITSSIVIPADKIAEYEFPSRKYLVTSVVALWSVPFTWSFVAMSEALFIPLFMWLGYGYLKYREQPNVLRGIILSIVISIMVATRNVGIVLVPAFLVTAIFDHANGKLKIARPKIFVGRSMIVAPPIVTYALWKYLLERPDTSGQTIGNYMGIGMKVFISLDHVVTYIKIWLGQLTYLTLASGGLFIVLALHVFFLRHKFREDPASYYDGSDKKSLVPLMGFFIIASVFLIIPSTIHMFLGHLRKPLIPKYNKYLMYGRYLDMILPVIVLYGIGFMDGIKKRMEKRQIQFFIGGSLIWAVASLLIAVRGGSGFGIRWFYFFKERGDLNSVLYSGCIAWIGLLAYLYAKRNLQYCLIGALLTLQVFNFGIMFKHFYDKEKLIYEQKDRSYLREAKKTGDMIHEKGGRLFYADYVKNSKEVLIERVAKYCFYGTMEMYEEGTHVDDERDFFIYQNRLYSAREYLKESGNKVYTLRPK